MYFPSADGDYHGVGRPSNTGERGSSAEEPIAVIPGISPPFPTNGVRGIEIVGERGSPAPRNSGTSATGVRGTCAVGDRGSSGPSGNVCPA